MAFEQGTLRLPTRRQAPLKLLGQRLLIAIGLITFVATIAYLDRDGYQDNGVAGLTLLDAFYYSTVSVTTTGYGDIYPVSEQARFLTTILITPARILFLIVLVGTTVEVLAGTTLDQYRQRRWRKRLSGHTILCGFGATGQAAARTILARDPDPSRLVVIDTDAERVEMAGTAGLATVHGNATHARVLQQAGIADAKSVVVASSTDESIVLITLTARELNPNAVIAAKVRDEENAHLVRQSGATSVVVSSGAAGRLLGHAPRDPRIVELLEDLLSFGEGLDIVQCDVGASDAGPVGAFAANGPVIAVLRGEDLLRFDDPRAQSLEAGDCVVSLGRAGETAGA
ncbi:MAG: potassium channel family protein [Solirubrobacteraceae bacterium]|nr:potassium channel family protein [Solirubrobacteraceae bacterium]